MVAAGFSLRREMINRNVREKKHIIYILDNPVRKGLVSDWKDYPFKGSLDFSLEDITS